MTARGEYWMPPLRNPDKGSVREELALARASRTVACSHLERRKRRRRMDEHHVSVSVLHCTALHLHLYLHQHMTNTHLYIEIG